MIKDQGQSQKGQSLILVFDDGEIMIGKDKGQPQEGQSLIFLGVLMMRNKIDKGTGTVPIGTVPDFGV